MNIVHTTGILLQKTMLPNDDVILECFSAELGKISIFCSKLARSKKKIQEIDYFRLLEFDLRDSKGGFKLSGVNTKHCFTQFSSDYSLMQKGFSWFGLLRERLPEGKVDADFFAYCISVLAHIDSETVYAYDVFLRFKLLQVPASIPRFDQIQDSVYFCPQNFVFSDEAFENSMYIENLTRQIIEFIRRSDHVMFREKINHFPYENLRDISEVIEKIEQYC